MRAYACARECDYRYFYNSNSPSLDIRAEALFFDLGWVGSNFKSFLKNDTLFYGKRHVVLWKTTRCFERNQHNMLDRFRLKFAED